MVIVVVEEEEEEESATRRRRRRQLMKIKTATTRTTADDDNNDEMLDVRRMAKTTRTSSEGKKEKKKKLKIKRQTINVHQSEFSDLPGPELQLLCFSLSPSTAQIGCSFSSVPPFSGDQLVKNVDCSLFAPTVLSVNCRSRPCHDRTKGSTGG